MFFRTLPLVLIAAIVACPLLCRNGHCQECCAQKQSLQSTCSAPGTDDCCCCLPTCDSHRGTSDDGDGPRPCDDDSGETGCQGVCGGAVFEKSNSRPATTAWSLLNHFGTSLTPPARMADRHPPVVKIRFIGGMPPGRYIRTLHMSFLL